MPSLKCRFFVFMLKNRHFLRFQLKGRPFVTKDTNIPKLREEIERGSNFFGKVPSDFKLEPVNINGLPAEWMIPPQGSKEKVMLYFHGGGYATGSIKAHRVIVSKFVKESGVSAFLFDYRLAPENPYPAALDDAMASYQYLLDQGVKPSNIAFVGDSAGAGLVFATLLAVRDKGMPLPSGAVGLSPWTDLANTGESWVTNRKKDTLSWPDAQKILNDYYVGNGDPRNPYISPWYGDLRGLPPMQIYVGGDETLLSDSTRFAEKAKAAGVDVTLTVGEGLFHCYPACAPLFPEATEAMAELCRFVKLRVGS